MIKRMIIATVILFAVLLLMRPKTDEASKKKMASAAMLMCSNNFREAVAEQVLNEVEVELAFTNSCPSLIAQLDVAESGEITVQGTQHGVTLVLTPEVKRGEVHWSCRGEPVDAVTKLCRP